MGAEFHPLANGVGGHTPTETPDRRSSQVCVLRMGCSEVPSLSGCRWRSREDRVDHVSCGTWEEEVDPGMAWAGSHPTHKGAVKPVGEGKASWSARKEGSLYFKGANWKRDRNIDK